MKRRIRLSESDLHSIIKESVHTILNELNSLTADSAYVKARDEYKRLSNAGRENTPEAQRRKRQMDTFNKYNEFNEINSPEDIDKKNEYGNTMRQNLTDYADAYGMDDFDPYSFAKTEFQYQDNGGRYDHTQMSQKDMNQHERFSNLPYVKNQDYSPSRMKSPQQLGLRYQKGKNGFLGIGKKPGRWTDR